MFKKDQIFDLSGVISNICENDTFIIEDIHVISDENWYRLRNQRKNLKDFDIAIVTVSESSLKKAKLIGRKW